MDKQQAPPMHDKMITIKRNAVLLLVVQSAIVHPYTLGPGIANPCAVLSKHSCGILTSCILAVLSQHSPYATHRSPTYRQREQAELTWLLVPKPRAAAFKQQPTPDYWRLHAQQ